MCSSLAPRYQTLVSGTASALRLGASGAARGDGSRSWSQLNSVLGLAGFLHIPLGFALRHWLGQGWGLQLRRPMQPGRMLALPVLGSRVSSPALLGPVLGCAGWWERCSVLSPRPPARCLFLAGSPMNAPGKIDGQIGFRHSIIL